MSDIIKNHDENVNQELFCAAVVAGENALAKSIAPRLEKVDFKVRNYFRWLHFLSLHELRTISYHPVKDSKNELTFNFDLHDERSETFVNIMLRFIDVAVDQPNPELQVKMINSITNEAVFRIAGGREGLSVRVIESH